MSSTKKPASGSRQNSLSSNSLSPDAEPWNSNSSNHPLDTPSRRDYPGGAIPRHAQINTESSTSDVQHSQGDCVPPHSFTVRGNVQPVTVGGSSEIVTAASSSDCKSQISSEDFQIKGDNSSSCHTTKESMQTFIDRYRDLMPPELQVGYYDVMILYSEEDREAAEEYKRHLMEEIVLEKGHRVKAVLYDDQEMVSLAGSKIKGLEYSFQRCTFAFVFLTKAFCDCEWCAFSSEECLMEAIYNPKKKWCVVPVYTVQRSKADFKIPMGLNSLKGVNYYNNDQFYQRGLKRLIGDKLHVRIKNENKHFEEQYTWACKKRDKQEIQEFKRKQMVEKQQRQNQEMHRILYSQSIPGISSEHSDKPDSNYLQNIVRSKSEQFNYPTSVDRLTSISSKSESAYVSLASKSSVLSEHSMRQPSEGDERCHFTLDEELSLDQGPQSHDSDYSVDTEIQGVGTLSQASVHSQEKVKSTNQTTRTTNVPSSSVIIHEHHHYYEKQPTPTVINYNIDRASNVVVGKGGTIISGPPPEDYVLVEEDTQPKHSGLSPLGDPSVRLESRAESRPSIDSPTNKTFVACFQQTDSKIIEKGNNHYGQIDPRLQAKGASPLQSASSTEKTLQDDMPLPSVVTFGQVRPVQPVPPMRRERESSLIDSCTSEKTLKEPVPTTVHPLCDDDDETFVKDVSDEGLHETVMKSVTDQHYDNPHEGELRLDSQTGCKEVTSGPVDMTHGVERTVPFGKSRCNVNNQTTEPNSSHSRLSETSLETDSGEVSGEEKVEQRDRQRNLVMRGSDTSEGFVEVNYGTDVDAAWQTNDEKRLNVVIEAVLEMGFGEDKIKSALEKMKWKESRQVELSANDLVNEILRMPDVPPSEETRENQHANENMEDMGSFGRGRPQRNSRDSGQQSDGLLARMRRLFRR